MQNRLPGMGIKSVAVAVAISQYNETNQYITDYN